MEDKALITFTSHTEGKNSEVSVYSDRLEWTQPKGISKGKVVAGLMTAGLSLAVTGFKGGRQGNEMIPIKSITSVTAQKDGLRFWKVSVIASGNTIDFRVFPEEAKKVKEVLTQLILGSHSSQQPAAISKPDAGQADVMEQLSKLAQLRDAGVLTEDEFQAKKTDLLSRM